MSIDPVCKMEVDEKSAVSKSVYQGRTYFFVLQGAKRPLTKTLRNTFKDLTICSTTVITDVIR